ncbi:sodium-independent sulfate anion transporter [Teleopsis dalmanni]|uniref:sodium-independent sulfate anion transporter-like n=1 Tax=Teleopsis dalmanni TaxID=139649 RepID=UPI0018CEBCF6|nr:sodium-independent sulfate anion transporter-like [Teleopsis dalmanni]XP_037955843.1 sodium-independent sulfate anion transporter [Teleopsis dalmanni]XP_037955844.1 sodium-independent sulfate anion transporter [Teleopsis dalmanni]XP_037955845.1 sodium-independent sulfate anion transporter [Teleopsis dalmanni]
MRVDASSTRESGSTGSEISLNIPPSGLYNGSSDCIIQEDDPKNSLSCWQVSCEWIKQTSANVFRKKTLYKRMPILTWLPKYNRHDFIGDFVAGITVGLTVIPQGLAYAGIAGLDLQYGLYGCFLGCFIYIFIGSSKDVPVGPTAISALLTFQTAQGSWERAVLLTFLTGLIEICMGVFQLGFLIDFVSGPVSAGFTSAVSLIIFTSQLKDILGVNTKGVTFLDMWISIVNDIHNISWYDAALGLCCIVVLLTMRVMASTTFGPKEGKKGWQKFLTGLFWLIGTSRNAVLVCAASGFGYYLLNSGNDLFRMVGYVPKGLPNFQLPPFSLITISNTTTGETVSTYENFGQMVSNLGSGLIVVPLISLLENMAVVQAFANGKPCDATQELIAIGVCNVANSFVQGFRGNGGIARGAVLNASGCRTQLSNLYTGVIVIIALLYLTPAFYYIPKATLAAIIVAAVIFMIQYRVIKPMWRTKKTDLIPGIAAFIACLVLPLQIGILVGIGINVVFILYHAARPKLRVETLTTSNDINYLMLTPDRCLIFPSVEFVRNVINKQGRKSTLPVIIDCTHIYGADFTAAKVVSTMIGEFQARNQKIFFYNLQPRVAQVFVGLNKDLVVLYDMNSLEMELSGKAHQSIQ